MLVLLSNNNGNQCTEVFRCIYKLERRLLCHLLSRRLLVLLVFRGRIVPRAPTRCYQRMPAPLPCITRTCACHALDSSIIVHCEARGGSGFKGHQKDKVPPWNRFNNTFETWEALAPPPIGPCTDRIFLFFSCTRLVQLERGSESYRIRLNRFVHLCYRTIGYAFSIPRVTRGKKVSSL